MKAKVAFFITTLVAVTALIFLKKEFNTVSTVCINEVRGITASKYRDGFFGSDYIELYNTTNTPISLEGWYLSDEESDLLKSRISNIVIEPKSYAVFYAIGEENEDGQKLNFKISSSGEKIFLSNSAGELVDSVLIPELKFGEVYAREKDGKNKWLIKAESLLASNETAEEVLERALENPVFSHESGFYDEAFSLELRCNRGETIYYTLDGSVPTENSNIYRQPIKIENISARPNVIKAVRNIRTDWIDWWPDSEPVDKAIIVRAISKDKNNRVSEVITKTYFVELDQYKNKNIISVVAEYDDLFGDDGIFVTGKTYDEQYASGVTENLPQPNFAKSGRRYEVLGNLEYFSNGVELCNQLTGIRTYGGSSRYGKIKRMSLYSRNEYSGNEYFEGITLGGRNVHSMGTNGDYGNLILPQLVLDRSVAVQGIERTHIFINGEYYSNNDLIEKYSKQYFEQRYGIQEDNLVVYKDGEVSEGKEEHILFYKWLLKQAETLDLSVEENYSLIEELMDVQSYIDYICANVYLCNMDVSQDKNYMFWRSVEDDGTIFGDTRFRWMMYDMGALDSQIKLEYYDVEEEAEVNSFSAKGRHVGHSINEQTLYQALKENESYCKQFVISFMDMANVNFSMENVGKVFTQWEFDTDLYDGFFEKRFDYIVPYLAEEFDLTGTLEEVTLKVNDVNGGSILLNTTTPDLSEGSWSGKYYTDYPVTVTAIPAEGYEFVGWSGSVDADGNVIDVDVAEGGITLEALFEKE